MIKLNGKIVGNKRFPNGELNILDIEEAIHNLNSEVFGKHMITFKYEDDSELISLMFIKKQLDIRSELSTELTIAYLPYSRMDRAETIETPFTLKFICEFINWLEFDNVIIYEPHSEVSIELLDNVEKGKIVLELVKEVLESIDFDYDNDYIVYPDKTALKRYGDINAKNKLHAEKNRDFATGKILGLEIIGEVKEKGFNALLVDDMSSFGGSFIYTAKELKKLGANEIYLLVGHSENSIFKGELFTSGLINKVFTTDTILTDKGNIKKFINEGKLTVYAF